MTETKPVTLETISRQLEETQAAIREIRKLRGIVHGDLIELERSGIREITRIKPVIA